MTVAELKAILNEYADDNDIIEIGISQYDKVYPVCYSQLERPIVYRPFDGTFRLDVSLSKELRTRKVSKREM